MSAPVYRFGKVAKAAVKLSASDAEGIGAAVADAGVRLASSATHYWFETAVGPEALKVKAAVRELLYESAEVQDDREGKKMLMALADAISVDDTKGRYGR